MTIATSPPDDATIRSLVQRIDRPLVLVGMMGVGKSTVGRKLAAVLDFEFVDADDEIVRAANMPVSDIFEQFGEPYFRDGERRVIARLMAEGGPGCVIATGGGAFVHPDTRALICETGIGIWLDCDTETLFERVGRNNRRPLLSGGNPRETLARLKRDREAAYREAPIHVESCRGPHSEAVNGILAALDRWL